MFVPLIKSVYVPLIKSITGVILLDKGLVIMELTFNWEWNVYGWIQADPKHARNPHAGAGRCKRQKFNSWVGKIPWRRAWQPILVFLPGESHGQRSLVGLQSIGVQNWT